MTVKNEVENTYGERRVNSEALGRIKEIQKVAVKKTMTTDTEKREKKTLPILKTLLEMNFFIYNLDDFQKYIKLFQRSEPLVHLLHEKQVELEKE